MVPKNAKWKCRAIVISALCLAMTLLPDGTMAHSPGKDGHAHNHDATEFRVTRTVANYQVPDVQLVREDGQRVRLRDELAADRTVVLSFIYTECTSICPTTSATLMQFQDALGESSPAVQIVSLSIDPERDSPARLTEYARQFQAGPSWHHYTGTIDASTTVQRAFGAYRGDKMNHMPLTLIRHARSNAWVRLDGLAAVEDLISEFKGTALAH